MVEGGQGGGGEGRVVVMEWPLFLDDQDGVEENERGSWRII